VVAVDIVKVRIEWKLMKKYKTHFQPLEQHLKLKYESENLL
jgi:hypothetical protein